MLLEGCRFNGKINVHNDIQSFKWHFYVTKRISRWDTQTTSLLGTHDTDTPVAPVFRSSLWLIAFLTMSRSSWKTGGEERWEKRLLWKDKGETTYAVYQSESRQFFDQLCYRARIKRLVVTVNLSIHLVIHLHMKKHTSTGSIVWTIE